MASSVTPSAVFLLLAFVELLSFSDAENLDGIIDLCSREPHLSMCVNRRRQFAARDYDGQSSSRRLQQYERDDPYSSRRPSDDDGGLQPIGRGRYGPARYSNGPSDPYANYYRKGYYYPYPQRSYYPSQRTGAARTYPFGSIYHLYPGLYPKNERYCPDMRGMFAWTCQPSKPLRLDLDYSSLCKVPNYHRLPGPRMGPNGGNSATGHVNVGYNFGFGIGVVPGLEVNAGWGVNVGPIPGMGDSVGVGLSTDLGLLGSKTPEAYRRGMDDPNQKGGGIVGVSGGVGVNPGGGVGPIGVNGGVGVGKK